MKYKLITIAFAVGILVFTNSGCRDDAVFFEQSLQASVPISSAIPLPSMSVYEYIPNSDTFLFFINQSEYNYLPQQTQWGSIHLLNAEGLAKNIMSYQEDERVITAMKYIEVQERVMVATRGKASSVDQTVSFQVDEYTISGETLRKTETFDVSHEVTNFIVNAHGVVAVTGVETENISERALYHKAYEIDLSTSTIREAEEYNLLYGSYQHLGKWVYIYYDGTERAGSVLEIVDQENQVIYENTIKDVAPFQIKCVSLQQEQKLIVICGKEFFVLDDAFVKTNDFISINGNTADHLTPEAFYRANSQKVCLFAYIPSKSTARANEYIYVTTVELEPLSVGVQQVKIERAEAKLAGTSMLETIFLRAVHIRGGKYVELYYSSPNTGEIVAYRAKINDFH